MKIKIKLVVCHLFLMISVIFATTIDVCFSPSFKCESKIMKLIDNTENTLDIVIYSLTSDNIVKALKRAKDRNVKIKILTDKSQMFEKNSRILLLHKEGFDIKVNMIEKGSEHNKFAIYDNKTISTGSANWTNRARMSSENYIFIEDENTVNKYKNRFEYLWKINKKEDSDTFFE
jgi:phosphatidylserine/phosphatidylglycerophosphate/cardiolipin synthase-like enzyme